MNWESNDVGCHLIRDSNGLVVKWIEIQMIWLSNDLRFKWSGCQMIWDSNDFGCQLIRNSNDLDVEWFEIQVVWLSNDLRFKWFGCQTVWDSSDLVVKWFEIQMIWLSIGLKFNRFGCQVIWDSSDLVVKWFEIQVIWLLIGLRFKWFGCHLIWDVKNEALKLKNEAFLRDFLQKWNFETQKRSFSARLPAKMKLGSSKTKFLCETSFKNDMSPRHWTSELHYVLAIFKRMLQKYCACHEKVEPRHTNSCNYHTKWSLQGNTSVTWNLQPFHGFCVGAFKHRHHKAQNPCACHASFRSLFKSMTPANV